MRRAKLEVHTSGNGAAATARSQQTKGHAGGQVVARAAMAMLLSLPFSGVANAAEPCVFTGSVGAYVSCIADQAFDAVSLAIDNAILLDESVACPDGWNSVASGRLCHDPTVRGPADMWVAIADCTALEARVCTHSDMQQACGVPGLNPYSGADTVGWYGDHGLADAGNFDDEYLTFNTNVCDPNNDGPPEHSDSVYQYFCCM